MSNRSETLHPSAYPPGELFHLVQFFQGRQGENVAVVFFQILFERSGDIKKFLRVLHVLFVIRFENLVLLFLAIGQADVFGIAGRRQGLLRDQSRRYQ